MNRRYMEIYRILLRAYGPRRWWPVTQEGGTSPTYTGGPRTPRQRFEVAAGAILTQNTAWSNASRAVESLNRLGVLSPDGICALDVRSVARAIRSAGYFNQKAKRLKIMAAFFRSRAAATGTGARRRAAIDAGASRMGVTREELLVLNGVGPETADSIMLYAFGEPYFVVDAYTRRLFGRLGFVNHAASYEEIRSEFERNIPRRADVYQEYHALIVEHGKQICRKEPSCENCLLKSLCDMYFRVGEGTVEARRS